MKEEVLISIIIPTYNRGSLIGATLDSILSQTYENWECIVVDDGSIDYTKELLELYSCKDSRIKYLERPEKKRKGANACRNFGFSRSSGDYILWFDSDDIMTIDYFKKAIEKIKTESNLDFVFFNYKIFDEKPFKIIDIQINKSISPLFDYFSGKINFSTCGVIWRKESISIGYNEKLKKTQELDFIFNNYKANTQLKGAHIDHTAYFLRKHGRSIVSSFKIGDPEFLCSDIFVRKELMDFFKKEEYPLIWDYQKQEFDKSLKRYLNESPIYDILKNFSFQLPFKKLFLLILYRSLYKITGRDYRLKKILTAISSSPEIINIPIQC
ncbi:hypothetical protein C7S20_00340 [Christiangramia fulva]|uniref:Glycosyltransferase 2-like domain-containing protein n=1 Tax=Christiangramia fulva TaxID=2126553 RepID=A0A2R3Z0R3_9FLAO|nr:glycosyltransferase family 2 protein [Christiangramia fulva]AVR43843.1 hypothetical protein C7S20_00340 [Christiangramia fulva]